MHRSDRPGGDHQVLLLTLTIYLTVADLLRQDPADQTLPDQKLLQLLLHLPDWRR